MISYRSVIRFLLIFFVTYAVLLTPYLGIRHKYAEWLSYQGNEIFGNIKKDVAAVFKPQKGDEKNDILLTLQFKIRPSGQTQERSINLNTGIIGYFPLVFLLSLITATPMTWKRKIIAFVVGYAVMYIFILLRMRVIILSGIALSTDTGMFFNETAKRAILFWNNYFARPVGLGYYLAIILWLALCLGKKQWHWLTGSMAGAVQGKKISHGKLEGKARVKG